MKIPIMNQFSSKSFMIRPCLMSFILLCTVFASENALSMQWKEALKEVSYDKKNHAINIKVQAYHFNAEIKDVYNFLNKLDLEYTVDGKVFTPLVGTEMVFQKSIKEVRAIIKYIKKGETISFPKASLNYNKTDVLLPVKQLKSWDFDGKVTKIDIYTALLEVNWVLPQSIKSIKSVRFSVKWGNVLRGKQSFSTYRNTLPVKFNSSFQNAPEESNSNVKVIGKADMVSVTGVNSGETIKVYNAFTNAEVKSVIAKDNLVNIRLPKGKVYLIIVGSKSTKVAL